MVGACSRSPPGSSASTPTIQKGEMVTISPAIPLGIIVSEATSAPLPTLSVNNPQKQAQASSFPLGKYRPRARENTSMIVPEATYRTHNSSIGGNDSSAMRIPRYVVPQKKHTAISARYGLNKGCRDNSSGYQDHFPNARCTTAHTRLCRRSSVTRPFKFM